MIVVVYKGRYCNGKISRSTCHVSVFRGQRQITEQNSTHACLTGAIPYFIIFDRMKDKLVVNTITEFDRYWFRGDGPVFRKPDIPKSQYSEKKSPWQNLEIF